MRIGKLQMPTSAIRFPAFVSIIKASNLISFSNLTSRLRFKFFCLNSTSKIRFRTLNRIRLRNFVSRFLLFCEFKFEASLLESDIQNEIQNLRFKFLIRIRAQSYISDLLSELEFQASFPNSYSDTK